MTSDTPRGIQTWIHYFEEGAGILWIKAFMLAVCAAAAIVAYHFMEARNFMAPEAMDQAQLGRNIAEGRGFTTWYIRPLSIHLLQDKARAKGTDVNAVLRTAHPDLENPPLYPVLLAGLFKRELNAEGLKNALLSTADTTAMVFMIFLGADMMNATLALTEMPKIIAQWVTHLPIPDLSIVILVLVLYVLLGCVMDELSMLLLTIPVIFPAIMGLDLWGLNAEGKAIWFGILVLMTVSIGMIAPPIGMNVYVVNSMAKEVPMSETYKGVMPFLVWDAIRVVLLLCFPVICLGLVKLLF